MASKLPAMFTPGTVQETIDRKDGMICRYAYDGSGNVEYIGRAAPGSIEDQAKWQITMFGYLGSLVVESNFANSDPSFVHVWDDRTGYTYG